MNKSPLDSLVSIYHHLKQVEVLKLREVLQYRDNVDKVGSKALRMEFSNLDQRIKNYRDTGMTIYKKGAPAYTPSGRYDHTKPRVGDPEEPSMQVQLDFDNQETNLVAIMKKYKWITYAGKSISGNSFYLLVNTDSKNYEGHFWALVSLFDKEGLKVDTAVSSINEIRYVGLQDEGHFNEKPTTFTKTAEKPKTDYDSIKIQYNGDLIAVPKAKIGKMRYKDLVDWVMINNLNGVPKEAVIAAVDETYFDKKSSAIKGDSIRRKIERIYDHYMDQHGRRPENWGTVMSPKGNPLSPKVADEPGPLERVYKIFNIGGKEGDTFNEAARKAVQYCIENTEIRLVYDPHKEQIYYRENNHLIERTASEAVQGITEYAVEKLSLDRTKAHASFFEAVRRSIEVMATRKFETNRNAFNMANGVLEFTKAGVEFRDHHADDTFTYIMEYAYDPKAKCPQVDRFMNKVIPDKADQETFWQYIASAFASRYIKIQKMLFLIGKSQSGKSTLLELIRDLFGEAVGTFQLKRLTDPDYSPVEIQNLMGKILGICYDGKRIIDHELFKIIAAQEPVTYHRYYSQPGETTDYPLMIVAMNHIVNIEEAYQGERRFIGIKMDVVIGDEEKDTSIREKLSAECSGVFNKVVHAYHQIISNGGRIKESDNAKQLRGEVVLENDLIQQWMDSIGLQVGNAKASKINRKVVLSMFNQWLEDNGFQSMNIRQFNKKMKDKGFIEKKSNFLFLYLADLSKVPAAVQKDLTREIK